MLASAQRNDRNKPQANLETAGIAPSRAIVQFCSTSCAIFSFDSIRILEGKVNSKAAQNRDRQLQLGRRNRIASVATHISFFISFERVARLHEKLVEH